jgi:hypothetical protein
MAQAGIERIQFDLDTIRDVVGTDLPYRRKDIRDMVSIGLIWLIATIATLLLLYIDSMAIRLTCAVIVVLVGVGITLRKFGNTSQYTVPEIREAARVNIFTRYASLLAFVFVFWSKLVLHIDMAILSSVYLYLFGSALFLFAITEIRRRLYLAVAVPFLLLALVRPLIPMYMLFPCLAAIMSLGSFSCAITIHLSLQRQEATVVTD